jgi:putative oxidoreductase
MQHTTSKLFVVAGRWLVGLYFLVPGLMKFAAFDQHLTLMQSHGLSNPGPLLLIAAISNVVGAILLFSNRFVRFTALGFVVYIVLINFFMHDFWHYRGLVGGHELQNFIKNLGILAGLLVLAGTSTSRPLVLKDILKSDKAYT